jgi:aryl-alcohol dehydrogenase-like predicted oxidoreductase
MQQRRLGEFGPTVSAIGLGCMGLTGSYGSATKDEAIVAIQQALDAGISLFNTADFYGRGENEAILGEALRGQRDRVVVATKLGIRLDKDNLPTVADGSPGYLKQACDGSLARLSCETIDIIILCRLDRRVPIEESVGAMSELVRAGKARAIGLSEVSSNTIRRAHSIHPIATVETEYSVWERHVEAEILPTLTELGIGLLAYSPLGRGLLTASVSSVEELAAGDIRRNFPQFSESNFATNKRLIEVFARCAIDKGVTPAQLALAWSLAQGSSIVPIPGSRSPERIRENADAARVCLSTQELGFINDLFLATTVRGDRYPGRFMSAIDCGS